MENEKRKPIENILTSRSEIEIIKDIAKAREQRKSSEEKAREAKIHYRTYEAGRRRDENETRYGRRRRLGLYNRRR